MAALHLAPQGFFQENLNSGQPARPCVAGAFPFCSVPLLLGSSHTHGLLCLPLMEVILAKGAPSPSVTLLLVSTTCLLCVDASGLLGCELRGQEGGAVACPGVSIPGRTRRAGRLVIAPQVSGPTTTVRNYHTLGGFPQPPYPKDLKVRSPTGSPWAKMKASTKLRSWKPKRETMFP